MIFQILARSVEYDYLKYELGGTGKNGVIDCSNFAHKVFTDLRMFYSYTSTAGFIKNNEINEKFDLIQSGTFTSVYNNKDLKPGDLIVTYGKNTGHVVIFLGYDKKGNPMVTQSVYNEDKNKGGVRPIGQDYSYTGYGEKKDVKTWVFRYKARQ